MLVAREGIPSWSYNQVEDETADRVHALEVPTVAAAAMDCTGADWFPAVVYSSMNTDCAVPDDAMLAEPSPTRTTARLVATKVMPIAGRRVLDMVAAAELVGVAEPVPVGVALADTDGVTARAATSAGDSAWS